MDWTSKNGDLTNLFELLGRGDGVKKKVNQFAIKFMSAITDTGAKYFQKSIQKILIMSKFSKSFAIIKSYQFLVAIAQGLDKSANKNENLK